MPQQVRESVSGPQVSTLSAGRVAGTLSGVGFYGVRPTRSSAQGRSDSGGAGAARAVGAMVLVRSRCDGRRGIIGLLAGGCGRAGPQDPVYEIKGHDPVVLVVSAVLLTLVALGAGLIPAHRASRVDPMRALRYE